MRPRKYGAMAYLRNSITRRHLFYNQRKGYSLDEVLEYSAGRCTGKWWEVHKVEVAENCLSLVRKLVLATPAYAVAWDLVKDADFVPRGMIRH